MIRMSDQRFRRVLALLVVAAVVMTSFLTVAFVSNRVKADSTISIYLDTSCTGKNGGSHGWSASMSNVYYSVYDASGTGTDFAPMTYTGRVGKNGGKIFRATVDVSTHNAVVFSSVQNPEPDGTDNLWVTQKYSVFSGLDKSIFMLNTTGYKESQSHTVYDVQGIYKYGQYVDDVDYSGSRFSILNMTNAAATIFVKYTFEIKRDGEFIGDTSGSDTFTYNIPARTYWYNKISVPSSGIQDRPYTTVRIWDNLGNSEKAYYLSEGKILGRTFEYGVTKLSNGSYISFQHENPATTYALNYKLYLERKSFTGSSAIVKGTAVTSTNQDGNAGYRTVSNITNGAFSAETGNSAKVVDLSNAIFSISYQGNTYNLFGPETEGDDLIVISDDVATVSGKYSVQSLNNELNGQKYITVRSDLYDYQYDHNSATDPNYTYTYRRYTRIVFTDNRHWKDNGGDVRIHYWGGTEASSWPGRSMKYLTNNDQNQAQYEYYIPVGTTYIIFNDNKGHQTVNISVSGDKGYYITDGADNSLNVGTWNINNGDPQNGVSDLANAKRPYVAINEAISKSTYGSTTYPMYLGQFWLPNDSDNGFGTSDIMYTNATASRQRAGHNFDKDKYYVTATAYSPYDQTSGYYTNFGFGEILQNFKWPANLAYRTSQQDAGSYKPYDAVAQDLVHDYLVNGQLVAPDGSTPIPYFDTSWWSGTFTTSQGRTVDMSDYIRSYENLAFPFFEIDGSTVHFQNVDKNGKLLSDNSNNPESYRGKYYVFDSKNYVVRTNQYGTLDKYNSDLDNQLVYDNYGTRGSGQQTSSGQEVGLFPFNTKAEGGANSRNLHYGYGIKYTIEFYLNENGTVDGSPDGIPITFTFQGDDDVWVFLDDYLLLDMGGAHKNAAGEINFKNKNAWISAVGNASDPTIVSSGKDPKNKNFSNINSKYLTVGKHTITMFYMERGMLNSNLYVMFNLPMSLTKYELQSDTDFSGVNEGFLKSTEYIADSDVFNYKVENRGTTNVVGSDIKVPSNNSVTRQNGESKINSTDPTVNTQLSSGGSAAQHTNNFIAHPNDTQSYYAVGSVSYQLTDMFANNAGLVTADTTTAGIVPLQYGQMATFSKQFNYSSGMRVTLQDSMSKPNGSGGFVNSGRNSGTYYNTYMKSTPSDDPLCRTPYAGIYNGDDVKNIAAGHVDNMYDTPPNYSNNNIINLQLDDPKAAVYNFNDPTSATNEYVHIRQVVVNQVKTYSITLTKLIENDDDASDTTFNFNIEFSNIFGSTSGDGKLQMSDVAYTKYAYDADSGKWDNGTVSYLDIDGNFELNANDYIVISGIPVGTNYEITEENDEMFLLNGDASINLRGSMNEDVISVAYNKRKVGNLEVTKTTHDYKGNVDNTNTAEFDISVKLESIPDGVNFDKYLINMDYTGDQEEAKPLTVAQLDAIKGDGLALKIKNGNKYVFEGLPYGVTYSVSEALPEGSGMVRFIDYDDDDKEINDQYDSNNFLIYPPTDTVDVINRKTRLDVEKQVIIPNGINQSVYNKLSDNKINSLQFDMDIDRLVQNNWVNTPNKKYTEGANTVVGSDDKTAVNGEFKITNDYDKSGNAQTNQPHYDLFAAQFDGGERVRIREADYSDTFTTSYEYTNNIEGALTVVDPIETNEFVISGDDSLLVKNELKLATLKIKKTITAASDEDLTFNFTVTLTNVAGQSYNLTNGQSVTITKSVTIQAGQTENEVEITGIPVNTAFVVAEDTGTTGYVLDTPSEDLSGTVSANGSTVNVTNKKPSVQIEMPETGAAAMLIDFTAIGIFAMSLAGAAILIYRRKIKAVNNKDEKGRYMKK